MCFRRTAGCCPLCSDSSLPVFSSQCCCCSQAPGHHQRRQDGGAVGRGRRFRPSQDPGGAQALGVGLRLLRGLGVHGHWSFSLAPFFLSSLPPPIIIAHSFLRVQRPATEPHGCGMSTRLPPSRPTRVTTSPSSPCAWTTGQTREALSGPFHVCILWRFSPFICCIFCEHDIGTSPPFFDWQSPLEPQKGGRGKQLKSAHDVCAHKGEQAGENRVWTPERMITWQQASAWCTCTKMTA